MSCVHVSMLVLSLTQPGICHSNVLCHLPSEKVRDQSPPPPPNPNPSPPQLHIGVPAWARAKEATWANHEQSLLQQGTVEATACHCAAVRCSQLACTEHKYIVTIILVVEEFIFIGSLTWDHSQRVVYCHWLLLSRLVHLCISLYKQVLVFIIIAFVFMKIPFRMKMFQ